MTMPDFALLPDGSINGEFLHGIDLTNEILVSNICVAGQLWTTDYMGTVDPGLAETHRPIGDIPLEELAASGPYGNVLSPRSAKYLIPAAIWDRGQIIVDGYGEPREYSAGTKMRITETRDIEIAFEEGRRRYAPKAPSRLSCIWLAENSTEGRGVILSMLPKTYIAIVRVKVCAGIAVADACWFDDYMNDPKPDFIENYWAGVRHPKISVPEILVDGVIQFVDPDQLEHIKMHRRNFATRYAGAG